MSRSTTHRSSDVNFNGKALQQWQSGRVTAANSTQKFGFVSICDGTIVQLLVNIVTALTNAAAALQLGTETSLTRNLANLDIHSYAAGLFDLTPLLASATVSRGDAIVFSVIDGDTTGLLDAAIVIEPR